MLLELTVFVPVYRFHNREGELVVLMGGRTFQTVEAARKVPVGPFVPHDIEVIDVIPVDFVKDVT